MDENNVYINVLWKYFQYGGWINYHSMKAHLSKFTMKIKSQVFELMTIVNNLPI